MREIGQVGDVHNGAAHLAFRVTCRSLAHDRFFSAKATLIDKGTLSSAQRVEPSQFDPLIGKEGSVAPYQVVALEGPLQGPALEADRTEAVGALA